jgi:Cft2 family RNA processing exonuclease
MGRSSREADLPRSRRHGHRIQGPARGRSDADFFSAHADQAGLLAWLRGCERPPRRVFVTHGEPMPADTLRRIVKDELGFPAHVPEYRESVALA